MPFFVSLGNYIGGDNDCEIKCIVLDLTNKCKNDTQKVINILNWFDKNTSPPNFVDMNYRSGEENTLLRLANICYIYKDPPHFCFRLTGDPHWIISSKCGRCGEHADLFLDMATKAGLQSRKIHCIGENHEWNEVYISEINEWIVVDATAVNKPKGDGFKDYDFMEGKVGGDLRAQGHNVQYGNVSYVFATYYENGVKKTIDRTKNYTGLANITLNVTDSNGLPIKGINVKVVSHNRPGWTHEIGKTNKTDENGQCIFSIGGGNYHFILENEEDGSSMNTGKRIFNERAEPHYMDVVYDGESWIDRFIERLPVTILLIIVGIVALLIIYYIGRKYPPKKSN